MCLSVCLLFWKSCERDLRTTWTTVYVRQLHSKRDWTAAQSQWQSTCCHSDRTVAKSQWQNTCSVTVTEQLLCHSETECLLSHSDWAAALSQWQSTCSVTVSRLRVVTSRDRQLRYHSSPGNLVYILWLQRHSRQVTSSSRCTLDVYTALYTCML